MEDFIFDISDVLNLKEQITNNTHPESVHDKYELNRGIHKMLLTLTPREERVIRMYFYENKTLKEIGDDFCLTKSMIARIMAKALRKCRHPGRIKLIEGYSRLGE